MISFTFATTSSCCYKLLSALCCCKGVLYQDTEEMVHRYRLQSDSESSSTSNTTKQKDTTVVGLGALLDARDSAIVTLVAGNTRLAAHRAVLVAGSPVLAALLRPNTLEVNVPGIDGPVLRQLVAFLYSGTGPVLLDEALRLVAVGEKFGVSALNDFYEKVEQKVAEMLSVENVTTIALLAHTYGSHSLRQIAVAFIREHMEVLSTSSWTNAVRDHPNEMAQITRLLIQLPAKTSATASAGSKPIPTATSLATPVAAGSTSTPTDATPAGTPTATTATLVATDSTSASADATSNAPTGAHLTQPPDAAAVYFCRSLSANVREQSLMGAAYEGEVQMVRALLAAGADVEARDGKGMTALHQAAYRGHVEVVECLLQAGAEVDARSTEMQTPLHLAAVYSDVAVVKLLLASSADVGARQRDGTTPLHNAAFWGHAEAAAALLEAGADKGARDDDGRKPLDLASLQKLKQMLQ